MIQHYLLGWKCLNKKCTRVYEKKHCCGTRAATFTLIRINVKKLAETGIRYSSLSRITKKGISSCLMKRVFQNDGALRKALWDDDF
jgi:hypothetical protein